MSTVSKRTDFYVVQLEKEAAQRKATRAMLAALEMAARMTAPNGSHLSAARRDQLHHMATAAIAQAEAAGIKAEG